MDKFDIHPDCVGVERAHRVGRFNPQRRQSPRPIIAVFRDYITTENIISQGRLLRGTQYGVSRDYPVEIKKMRVGYYGTILKLLRGVTQLQTCL